MSDGLQFSAQVLWGAEVFGSSSERSKNSLLSWWCRRSTS